MSHPSTLLAILFSSASLGMAPLHAQDMPSIYQPANAPQPLPPLPTPSQFRWHQQELQIFSKWRGVKGEVVGEFVKACRNYGLGVGIHLSPWNRHDKRYGSSAYNDYYMNQANELSDRYGKIDSFRLVLAFKDECYSMPFDWDRIYDAMCCRNPAVTIEMSGPDVGWIGNEAGSGLDQSREAFRRPCGTG
ncbi:MAG: hypothetical protein J0M04_16090 [Verrucomicrobia bacterium]|nr:hypothetical protein [Verrucomicrobiota bacterium]